jgi:hypothetical protein
MVGQEQRMPRPFTRNHESIMNNNPAHYLCSFLAVGEDCELPWATAESTWMVTPSSLSSDGGVAIDASALSLRSELVGSGRPRTFKTVLGITQSTNLPQTSVLHVTSALFTAMEISHQCPKHHRKSYHLRKNRGRNIRAATVRRLGERVALQTDQRSTIGANIILVGAELSALCSDSLKLLLSLGVGIANVHDEALLANSSTVVLADNIFALITRLEAAIISDMNIESLCELTHRANPTPRLFPMLSRRILLERIGYPAKMAPSSCSCYTR